jgi:hypothetical protein
MRVIVVPDRDEDIGLLGTDGCAERSLGLAADAEVADHGKAEVGRAAPMSAPAAGGNHGDDERDGQQCVHARKVSHDAEDSASLTRNRLGGRG